jgi:cell division protein FtsB
MEAGAFRRRSPYSCSFFPDVRGRGLAWLKGQTILRQTDLTDVVAKQTSEVQRLKAERQRLAAAKKPLGKRTPS